MKCPADAKVVKKEPTNVNNNAMEFDFTDRSSVMTGNTNVKKPGGD